jgi:hypothetical protein
MAKYTAEQLAAMTAEDVQQLVLLLQDSNEDLATDNDKLAKGIDDANKTIAQLNEVIATAQSKGASAAIASTAAVVLEHEGKNYKWNRKSFILPGKPERYNAEDAAANPELITELLAIEGQNVLLEQA